MKLIWSSVEHAALVFSRYLNRQEGKRFNRQNLIYFCALADAASVDDLTFQDAATSHLNVDLSYLHLELVVRQGVPLIHLRADMQLIRGVGNFDALREGRQHRLNFLIEVLRYVRGSYTQQHCGLKRLKVKSVTLLGLFFGEWVLSVLHLEIDLQGVICQNFKLAVHLPRVVIAQRALHYQVKSIVQVVKLLSLGQLDQLNFLHDFPLLDFQFFFQDAPNHQLDRSFGPQAHISFLKDRETLDQQAQELIRDIALRQLALHLTQEYLDCHGRLLRVTVNALAFLLAAQEVNVRLQLFFVDDH